jgi:hypothetical protein
MTKDELIARQEKIIGELTALILKLFKIGQEGYQKAFDLFCKIEVLPKHTEPEPIVPAIDPKKLIVFSERRRRTRAGVKVEVVKVGEPKKEDKKAEGEKTESHIRPCPRCPEHRPRKVYSSGAIAPYCEQCLKDINHKRWTNRNNKVTARK